MWIPIVAAAILWAPESAAVAQEAVASPTASDSGQLMPELSTDVEIRAASFQGITPGQTSAAELREAFGEPNNRADTDGETVLTYQIGPFPKVEVLLSDGIVTSIVAYLPEPRSADAIIAELKLPEIEPVAIRGDERETLGEVFPERGIMLSYTDPQAKLVGQLVLEPISSEAFWLRFSNRSATDYEGKLSDLAKLVTTVDPDDTEAYWQQATILRRVGNFDEAYAAAERAAQLDSENFKYVLTFASLLADNGDHAAALEAVQSVLKSASSNSIRSQAFYEWGNLAALGDEPDYKASVQHYLKAIKLATPLAAARNPKVKVAAKLTLIRAHLGVAKAIVHGNWDRKQEVAMNWLHTALQYTNALIEREGYDKSLSLTVWRHTINAYAELGGEGKIDKEFNTAVAIGEDLLASADDPLYRQQLQWEMLQILFAKTRIEQVRQEYAKALQHAGEAIELLDKLPQQWADRPETAYLAGRLYYYVGAIYAVDHQDHKEAVRWYEKAQPLLQQDLPAGAAADLGIHGERFVSMGVSYWKTGVKNEAQTLTRKGLVMMRKASQAGLIQPEALATGYNNLAEMYRAAGKIEAARKLAAYANRLSNPDDETTTQ